MVRFKEDELDSSFFLFFSGVGEGGCGDLNRGAQKQFFSLQKG